jgi:hypothetical protein
MWCRVLFKSSFQLKIHQHDCFSEFFFFIFDINTLKHRKTPKKHKLYVFSCKKQLQKHF